MTIRRLRCKRESCRLVWIPRTPNPKWCPRCHYGEFEERTQDTLKIDEILHGTPIPTAKRKYKKRNQSRMITNPTIQSYCLACRGKRLMKKIWYCSLKNERRVVRGVCSSCGKKMCTIVKTNKSVTEKNNDRQKGMVQSLRLGDFYYNKRNK